MLETSKDQTVISLLILLTIDWQRRRTLISPWPQTYNAFDFEGWGDSFPSVRVYCVIFPSAPLSASAQWGAQLKSNGSQPVHNLPTMANFTSSFLPCFHTWQFAFRVEACKSLIRSDFHWFCSQLQHLVEADCGWNCHNTLLLQKLPFRVIQWMRYSTYPIYVFKQSSSVSGNRLPLWLVWLWGEIYGLVKLLNEKINRFVFDIVCCIQKYLHAPLFNIHF